MQQVTQRITSLTSLLEFEYYYKYFASRTYGVSSAIDQLYEKIFADPSYAPFLAMSTNLVQLLNEIKLQMPNETEYKMIEHVEQKHYRRFWATRSDVLRTQVLGSYFFRIQIERTRGLPSAFEIAFDAKPMLRLPRNVCIFRSKNDLIKIGNCIEIGQPEHSQNTALSFQQQMDQTRMPHVNRPWYLFVNEANIEAYEEVLSYMFLNVYFGAEQRVIQDRQIYLKTLYIGIV